MKFGHDPGKRPFGPDIIFIVKAHQMWHARQGSCICFMILDLLSGTLHVDGLQPSTP